MFFLRDGQRCSLHLLGAGPSSFFTNTTGFTSVQLNPTAARIFRLPPTCSAVELKIRWAHKRFQMPVQTAGISDTSSNRCSLPVAAKMGRSGSANELLNSGSSLQSRSPPHGA